MITSFLKYVGGKRNALDKILVDLPENIKEYREPMIGSGIILLGVLQTRRRPEKIAIGDIDYDIANIWEQVINNPEELMTEVYKLRNRAINSNYIEELLINFNTTGVEAAAITLVSNICRRYGNYGNYLSVEECKSRLLGIGSTLKYKLYGVSNLTSGTIVRCEDYKWALQEQGEEVCVVLDPPYYKVSVKEGYYKDHNNFDFNELTQLLRETKHKFIMTLDLSEYSKSLEKWFNTQVYDIFYPMVMGWRQEMLIKNF